MVVALRHAMAPPPSTAVARIAASKAEADDQLNHALEEFRNKLSASDRAQLQAKAAAPDASSVVNLVTELNAKSAQRRGRCVAARLSRFLQSVEQFSRVVSTFVSSNPAIAALVWGSVQFTLLVRDLRPSQRGGNHKH